MADHTVVLYAQSGAGKTSLLNAGVVPLLESESFKVLPFARVRGPLLDGVALNDVPNIYAFYALLSWAGEAIDPETLTKQTMAKFLATGERYLDKFGEPLPYVVVFDQFEELFTGHPDRWRDREDFFNQVNTALQSDPLLHLVFSVREDYIAQLESYADLLPKNLPTRFHLERMRPGAALAAIRNPLTSTGRQFAPGVADQLVEDLRKVRVESEVGETVTVIGEFIEPVQLQVVCQNLWADLPADVTTITPEHLQTFGNVNQALASFYERALKQATPLSGLNEEELREWFGQTLITPAGTRGTVYRGLRQTGGIANQAIDELEKLHLIRGEWRAGARWYELTHDRLIEPIQESNRQWQEQRQVTRVRRIRRLAIYAFAFLGSFLLSLLGLFLLFELGGGDFNVETTAVANARATAQAANAAATAANATATAEAHARATLDAQATGAALAQATFSAQVTAEAATTAAAGTAIAATAAIQATDTAIARATVDAQATITAQELERLSQPVRPLRPGISVGGANTATAGTLSGFVRDASGNLYLLSPAYLLGSPGSPVLQPSPIDGGRSNRDVIATSAVLSSTNELVDGIASLISLARLENSIPFEITIPSLGPIRGVAEPVPGTAAYIVGRTSGFATATIGEAVDRLALDSLGVSAVLTDSLHLNDAALTLGDEGALVMDDKGYAIGIVINTIPTTVIAPLLTVLSRFKVEFVHLGQKLFTLQGHELGVLSLAFSPDGHWLASGSGDQTIRLWDMNEPRALATVLNGHEDVIRSVTFSPNGRWLASGGDDQTIRLWDMNELATPISVLRGHENWVWSVAFSPDGRWLASGSADQTVRLWDIEEAGMPATVLGEHESVVRSVAFSPNGRWLASGSYDQTVRLWDMNEPNTPATVLYGEDKVGSVAFSPDGRWLASGSVDGAVRLWDMNEPGTLSVVLSEHGNEVLSVAFSPDGNWLASGSADGTVRLWDMNEPGTSALVLSGHSHWVWPVAFSPDRGWLASGSFDMTIAIWQVR
jgi:WD40 repeat protein